MFNIQTFKSKLTTQWLGRSLLFFEELNSTNTYLKRLPAEEISHGLVCLTDYQTKGRGQYEKNWESRPGQNLTFTLTFLPGSSGRFHILTLACAKAAIDLINKTTGLNARIRWPNDVYLNGKKLGGLLTEATFSGNNIDRLLVGIGLNINQESFSPDLSGKATSLKTETGENHAGEEFLADLLSYIEYEYGRWHKRDVEQLKEINKKIIGYGEWVTLEIDGDICDETAKLLGINEEGQLAVLEKEGEVKTYSYEQIRVISS